MPLRFYHGHLVYLVDVGGCHLTIQFDNLVRHLLDEIRILVDLIHVVGTIPPLSSVNRDVVDGI